jgi:DNA-binding GntR family transcriptional regulator
MQTESQLAQRYKISVPTIRRRIAALKQQGLVTVEVVRKGRHTYS